MQFTSALFLVVFMPLCVLPIYFARKEHRNWMLLVASIAFYAWCGLKFLALLIVSSLLAYILGLLIDKTSKVWIKRLFVTTGILFYVGQLFYYKYLFSLFPGVIELLPNADRALPLGISFYTFSVLSYILDVYWGKVPAQENVFNILLYILFFPKIIQGPIFRYKDFEAQLNEDNVNIEQLDAGLERFIKGFFKKVMIADSIKPLADYAFNNLNNIGTIPAWIGIIIYMLQLYYDFSGYSDMAIGLGMMVGFKIPENFDHPYISRGVGEFWRRWHISLGEWFKDYIYTPCFRAASGWKFWSDNKHRKLLWDITALLAVWILTGIWHGSGLKFLVYGLWYFNFIAIERMRENYRKRVRKAKNNKEFGNRKWERALDHVMAVFAVIIGQVFFRATSLEAAIGYIKRMFIWDVRDGITYMGQLSNYMVFAVIVGIIFIFPIYGWIKKTIFDRFVTTVITYKLLLAITFFVTFCYAVSAGYSAFLYEVF